MLTFSLVLLHLFIPVFWFVPFSNIPFLVSVSFFFQNYILLVFTLDTKSFSSVIRYTVPCKHTLTLDTIQDEIHKTWAVTSKDTQ